MYKKIIVLFFSWLLILSIAETSYCSKALGATPPAKNESVFSGGYNKIHQFIDDHEYLLTPLAGAIAGWSWCGVWCAGVGAIAGTLDETLVYFGYADRRYLTAGILGAATTKAVKNSKLSSVAGIVVGALLPTGIFNDHHELVTPFISAVAGNSVSGTGGMINGVASGIVDELAIYSGFTDKHYLTAANLGMAAVNILGYKPDWSKFVGAALGMVLAQYEGRFVDGIKGPLKVSQDLKNTYSKFLPQKELNDHIEKQTLSLIGGQFLVQLLHIKILDKQQNLVHSFELLNNGDNAWSGFQSGAIKIAIFIIPYALGRVVTSMIDNHFNKKLALTLNDNIRSELFVDENPLRLSYNPNAAMLTDNLRSDVATLVDTGSSLISDTVSSGIQGAYGFGIVIVHSPDIFLYSILYNQATALVSDWLSVHQKSYDSKIKNLESSLVSTFKHDTENIRTITERGGVDLTREKIQNLSQELRENEGIKNLWSIANRIWWTTSGFFDYMLNYYLVGREVNQGRLPFEDRNKVQMANYQVSNLLGWYKNNIQSTTDISQALDRVVVIEGLIHAPYVSKDKIKRDFNDGNFLTIQDLEIGVGERSLVKVEDNKLELGKRYAITGSNGCGKTSLLSKIKGIKENGIWGKGNISYPRINGKKPKIVMISQQDYFPLDATLQEILIYPERPSDNNELVAEQKNRLEGLLQEVSFYGFAKNASGNDKEKLTLDSKKDWYKVLSGGEKKKVMLINAIYQKPDILILDEVLTGLDIDSIVVVEKMLRRELPESLILIVDHHAQENNYDKFYEGNFHFADGYARLIELV